MPLPETIVDSTKFAHFKGTSHRVNFLCKSNEILISNGLFKSRALLFSIELHVWLCSVYLIRQIQLFVSCSCDFVFVIFTSTQFSSHMLRLHFTSTQLIDVYIFIAHNIALLRSLISCHRWHSFQTKSKISTKNHFNSLSPKLFICKLTEMKCFLYDIKFWVIFMRFNYNLIVQFVRSLNFNICTETN